jgi:pyruvate,water dikinase
MAEIKRIIASTGLHRSPTFKVKLQIQIPANAYMLKSFIDLGIDGIDIDADILTALLLGTDNTNEEIMHAYDPLNAGVLSFFESLIKEAHKYKLSISMSGRAVTRNPTLVEKVVSWGITGLTVGPEAVEATRETVANAERKLIMKI